MIETFWTPERKEQLRKAVSRGDTYTVAGRVVGCTKNAAIGKARREGFKPGEEAYRNMNEHQQAVYDYQRRKQAEAKKSQVVEFPPPGRCVFPSGHPGSEEFGFCCGPVAAHGLPYCHIHMRKAYIPGSSMQARGKTVADVAA